MMTRLRMTMLCALVLPFATGFAVPRDRAPAPLDARFETEPVGTRSPGARGSGDRACMQLGPEAQDGLGRPLRDVVCVTRRPLDEARTPTPVVEVSARRQDETTAHGERGPDGDGAVGDR
jgi:hypothetical protein